MECWHQPFHYFLSCYFTRIIINDIGVIRFDGDPIPDKATITVARKSDKSQLESLIVEDEDALNVFDQAYLNYKQYDHYCEEGTRFVTRLKNNACVEVLRELEVDEENVIEEDLIIRLGKGKNQMKHDLRLVITKDTEGNPKC